MRHRGRVVEREAVSLVFTQPYGIGTSNKTIEAYLAELKEEGVTVVVDVRENPFSRFRPHFNRPRFQAALEAAGIKYIWMGNTLGNPKSPEGERSLQRFRDHHMQTGAYQLGIDRLLTLVGEVQGRIAVTCAEGNEDNCHRKFILEDLRERRAATGEKANPDT